MTEEKIQVGVENLYKKKINFKFLFLTSKTIIKLIRNLRQNLTIIKLFKNFRYTLTIAEEFVSQMIAWVFSEGTE